MHNFARYYIFKWKECPTKSVALWVVCSLTVARLTSENMSKAPPNVDCKRHTRDQVICQAVRIGGVEGDEVLKR